MDVKKRLDLVKRNTQEIIQEPELKALLAKNKTPVAYWGTAPTGKIHVGYLIPAMKIADFVKAGFTFKVLIADMHAHLDDLKTPWELLDARSKYYEEIMKALISAIGADIKKLEFVKGSKFQFAPNYQQDVLRMVSKVTLSRAKRAAAEVVRFGEEPKLGGFIYPLMQIEDVPALKADVAYGGIDQRGIYMLGREILPELGHQKPVCVFTPLLPGLTGGKMSASVEASKIDILDPEDVIRKKLSKAYCPAKQKKDNGVLAFVEFVIFPYLGDQKIPFIILRAEKYGGTREFKTYDALEKAYLKGDIHPADLKTATADALNVLLAPVKRNSKILDALDKKAYPK